MNKSVLAASVVLALASPLVQAVTISGTVTDSTGQPLSGAEVKIEGSRKVTLTDAQGHYQIVDVLLPNVHLHVSSARHIHGDKDLGLVESNREVDFSLAVAAVENILVTATALQNSVLESVIPVSVIDADTLRKVQAQTLGETLKSTPGVHSTYFGPVASSPIIRGNDGPRVKIVQNGLDVSDVSRVGPDHNVAANTSSAVQVEVLRGPATLQYGSGAIGGVVNVVDKRIPQTSPEGVEGEAQLNYSTVNQGKFASADVTGGSGNFAYHFDGFSRKTNDTDIPGYASTNPDDDEVPGTLENSAMDSQGFTGGLSLIAEEGYFGVAVETLDNVYGVPGHSHHHEEEPAQAHDAGTQLDVDMTRYQAAGEWYSPTSLLTTLKLSAAYTDYQHAEIEDGNIGTIFSNKGTDVRIAAHHKDIASWHGVVGLQSHHSDYEAIGDEAFTPATQTRNWALFLIEQRKFDNLLVELGARVERTRYNADDMAVSLHVEHEGEDHSDEMPTAFSFNDYQFTSTSMSAGVNWEYSQGQALAVTLSRNERAPSHQELFSAGQHLATQTFELGLVYNLSDDSEVAQSLQGVSEEISTNLDITLRKFIGSWGYTMSVFYNRADNYIYQAATGLLAIDEEHEASAEASEAHEEEGLPVYYFSQSNADIYGLEAEAFWDINIDWRLSVFGDYIRAKIETDDLPRIPPLRLGSTISYEHAGFSGDLSAVWYDEQQHIASFESATNGYTMVNATVQYEHDSDSMSWIWFAKANNLFDKDARVHTSFLKDQAPLPGRNITLGVRTLF